MENKFNTIKIEPKRYSNTFDKIISKKSSLPILPLTHKVDSYDAIKILNTSYIYPTECDVFEGEDLIYLFYGIPSYIVSANVNSKNNGSYFPVCFLLKNDNINIVNVFPFDSGAFSLKMYENYINNKMNIYDFALKTDFDYISRFIATFYNTNDDYYSGKTKNNLNELNYEPYEDFHIAAYINLITNDGTAKFDYRANTIELISNKRINIRDNLIALFVPFDLSRTKIVKDLKFSGVDIVTYPTFRGDHPESYNAIIKRDVYMYLKNKNLL